MRNLSRRSFLQGLSAVSGATAGSSLLLNPSALGATGSESRFLIVITASGGGSIIDGPLPLLESEVSNPGGLNCFPDSLVTTWSDSPFRAVDISGPSIGPLPAAYSVNASNFYEKRRKDLMVATWNRTSVNHVVGQKRSITGNEAWRGRTMQELVAWQYGLDAPIPNVQLLAGSGFSQPGTDGTIPLYARGQLVANPEVWPLSLDGSIGQKHPLNADILKAIREHRNNAFEPATAFHQVFQNAPRMLEWHDLRGTPQERIEGLNLINKLMLPPKGVKLEDFGLSKSPAAKDVAAAFPELAIDPFQAKAALAFMLLKYRVSVTVTLGPSTDFVYNADAGAEGQSLAENSIINPPLAFDSSHQGHRSGQAVVWDRIYRVIDGLIELLSKEDFGDGTSLWDHTMIYVASDFGRQKTRPEYATDWPTSHDINNGIMAFSPLIKGNTLFGGVSLDTAKTYGFNPQTGEPEPGRTMVEAEVFSGLLDALSIDLSGSGLPSVPVFKR